VIFILVSYDIPQDKRRLKVAKTLLDFGGERVQRSVFECHITARNFERLQERLRQIHEPAEDSIRFYTLCENCRPRIILLGQAVPSEEPGLQII
jgi:CRISPR-associated protein Cas2